jgi:tetratricopeptide (TPR) repeat protein
VEQDLRRIDKPRWLMAQTTAKGLVLLLALGLFFGERPRSFAQDSNPDVLSRQFHKLYQEGRYQEAIPLAEKLVAITQRMLGPDQPDTAISLNNLAALYYQMGAYQKAEPLYRQALQIWKKALGPQHPETAIGLNNLAELYRKMGAYQKAEPLYQQALQIRQKALGPQHPETAIGLNNLAELYRKMGAYQKAEPLFEQALQIRQKALGPEHPKTAESLSNLAALYSDMGDYAKAEPLYQQALRINQKALGPEDPATAMCLDNLGNLYFRMGDYAKAEPLYQQARQILQQVLGPEHPDAAINLNNLGRLYDDMGDYAKAEPLFQQSLQIRTKALGLEDPATALGLDNLGELYFHMGAYKKAEPLFQQALQICRKALGPEHPDTATSLNNLAALYFEMGEYAKAGPLYQEALRVTQDVVGTDHPATGISLNNLAHLYFTMGEYAKAEPFFQQALRINQKTLGPEHPETAESLADLGLLKFALGQIPEAKSLAQASAKACAAILSTILSFTSEQQRLAYQATLHPYALFTALDGSDAELASAVLRYKGVVLESLIEDRLIAEASKESEDRNLVGRLAADKRQLGSLLLGTRNPPSGEINKRIEDLEQEVQQIEGQLARHVAGLGHARRALSVDVEQVQSAIPKDGGLVEYVRYEHYLAKGQFEPQYGAIVLARTGPPHWIPLGNAKELDTLVSRYQRLVRNASDLLRNVAPIDSNSNQAELSANLEKLYEELWDRIEQSLPPDVKRVIISPDSQLNFISFATLLDPKERFLAEKYTVQYVASGRDLLRDVTPASGTEAIIFANPDFTLSPTQTIAMADSTALSTATAGAMPGTEKRDLEDSSFGPLDGTREECDRLRSTFEGWRWKADSFTGKDASKEALLQIHSPSILHLATHGFFLPEDRSDRISIEPKPISFEKSFTNSKFSKNPMHRSGLALAGANVTLQAWKRGEAPPMENDGIVTAEDVAALDLKGTWLVTLSACDTGSGQAKAGEGVMGLRRGFLQAGAQHLLMTLWPIRDQATVQIMSDFYDAARKSSSAPQALADVQRDWLIKLRKEHGLVQAVGLAGPFIMSSQGKP